MTSKQIGFTKAPTSGSGLTTEEIIKIVEELGCLCETEIKEALEGSHSVQVVDAFDVALFNAADAA